MSPSYAFKTPPWEHQREALKRALRQRTFCLMMEQRTGKSKVAIDFIACMHLWEGVEAALIVTPNSVIGRWHREIVTHMPDDIRAAIDIRVINYERLFGRERWEERNRDGRIVARGWDVVDNEELLEWASKYHRRIVFVFDESHSISNASSAIHRKAYRLVKDEPYVLELTGTPFHKKPLSIFGQWKLIDASVFGTSYGQFEKMYAIKGGYGNYQVVRYQNLRHMAAKIAPKAYIVKEADCWDIPEHRDEIVPVELEESREIYNTLADEAIVQLGSHEVDAALPITLALRLHQITGGFLRAPDGSAVPVGREKLRGYTSLLEELREAGRDKLVTFCRFRPEIAACARAALKVGYRPILLHGSVPRQARDLRIVDFEEANDKVVFISQIATGSMGLELSSSRDEIFYSLTNSLVHYDQARARIRGHKQKEKMTYWHLLANNSVDLTIYMALIRNRQLGALIMNHPEMLHARFSQ